MSRRTSLMGLVVLAAVVALLGLAAPAAQATTTYTWDNNGGGGGFTWNTAANWNPDVVPGNYDTALFTSAGVGTVTLGASRTSGSLTFQAGGYTISTNTLTLNGGTLWQTSGVGSGTNTISSTLAIGPGLSRVIVDSGTLALGTLNIADSSNTIGANYRLVDFSVSGSGAITTTTSNTNGIIPLATYNNGQGWAANNGSGTIILYQTASDPNSAAFVSDTGGDSTKNYYLTGSGTLNQSFSANTIMISNPMGAEGTLTWGTAGKLFNVTPILFNGLANYTLDGSDAQYDGPTNIHSQIHGGPATPTSVTRSTVLMNWSTNHSVLTLIGQFSVNGGAVTFAGSRENTIVWQFKDGTSSPPTLYNGAQTFYVDGVTLEAKVPANMAFVGGTPPWIISGGVLAISTSAGTSTTLQVGGTTALTLNAGTVKEATGISGGTLSLGGNITANSGASEISVTTLALGANRTFATTDLQDSLAVSSAISGAFTLLKSGKGTLTLSGLSPYTGVTTVSQGSLVVGANAPNNANGALGKATTAVILGDGSTGANAVGFFINGPYTMGRGLTVANQGSVGTTIGGTNTTGTATFGSTAVITLSKSANLTAAVGGTVDIQGDITGGFAITKIGGGTVVLTNNKAYSGATAINEGQLVVNGSLASSGVTVANGATLGGSGTVGGVTLSTGAHVAPGASPGTLTVGNITFGSGTNLDIELASATSFDKLISTGTLTVNGGSLNVTLGYVPANNDEFDILDWGSLTNTSNFVLNLQNPGNGRTWNTDELYTTGKITVVPEPATLMLMGLGLAGVIGMRRRRGTK